jgi:hypothetical protein
MARRRDEASDFARALAAGAVRGIELADGWTPEAAADWIWARVQPSAYAHLVGERGWTHAEFTERTVASLTDHLPRGAAGPEHR